MDCSYYLKQRQFEPSEIHLLIDAARSSFSLSEKHTNDLVTRLQRLLSVHERKRLAQVFIKWPSKKAKNCQVFWRIDQLHEAISRRVKVSFIYMQYSLDKTLVPKCEERYLVNPYGLVFNNERYCLVCLNNNEAVSMYYVDRMKDIILTNEALDPQQSGLDVKRSIERAINAYAGEPRLIVMYCKRNILDHLIDKFGTDIQIHERDRGSLEVRFSGLPNDVKLWALQYLSCVEIISPQWLRDEIMESIKANPYLGVSS